MLRDKIGILVNKFVSNLIENCIRYTFSLSDFLDRNARVKHRTVQFLFHDVKLAGYNFNNVHNFIKSNLLEEEARVYYYSCGGVSRS